MEGYNKNLSADRNNKYEEEVARKLEQKVKASSTVAGQALLQNNTFFQTLNNLGAF